MFFDFQLIKKMIGLYGFLLCFYKLYLCIIY
nr:MAG TPA: hypothetical protein [Caudoviricetes sp.]